MRLWIAGITSIVRRYRLWRSRWFGFPVGVWEPCEVRVVIEGRVQWCWRRLRADGDYEYRLLTDEQVVRLLEELAW